MITPFQPNGPICDFCSGPLLMPIDFYCRPFMLIYPNGDEYVDDGAWAARATCVPLVQNKDEKAIVNKLLTRYPMMGPAYVRTIRTMLRGFWTNQI